MTRSLSDYVRVYDATLPAERCQALIERFEAEPRFHDRMEIAGAYRYTEINVSEHWPDVEIEIRNLMLALAEDYERALKIGRGWPVDFWAEKLRLKRYRPGGTEQFLPHVDVLNAETSRRFLTAILYLNEPGGGETLFPDLGLKVAPAPGRMVIFPPLWLFPHAGLPPLGKPKYILHRYFLYSGLLDTAPPKSGQQLRRPA